MNMMMILVVVMLKFMRKTNENNNEEINMRYSSFKPENIQNDQHTSYFSSALQSLITQKYFAYASIEITIAFFFASGDV